MGKFSNILKSSKSKLKGFGSKAKGKLASAKESETGQKIGSAATKSKEWAKEYGSAFGEKAGGAVKSGAGAIGGALKSGGGFALGNWKIIAIILFVVGLIALIVFWFIAVGGGQAVLPGIGYSFQAGFDKILNSYSIKKFINMVQNPFGVGPTGGDYEDPGATVVKTPPNQAFSIELRSLTDTVLLNQRSLVVVVKINNLGNYKLSRVNVNINLREPFDGCLKFPDGTSENAVLYDLAPFSSKELIFSGLWIDLECVEENTYALLKPRIPVGGVVIVAKADTIYPTSSRLAIEKIKTDYGILLIKNNMLRQQKTGAIYRSGSAMTIDMDAGEQPIFDTINEMALLLRWQNMGSGKIPSEGKPFVFIVTPEEFGPCRPAGYTNYLDVGNMDCPGDDKCIACDEQLFYDPTTNKFGFCDRSSFVYSAINTYAPDSIQIFDWACGKRSDGFHVCATTTLTEEFNVFVCPLKLEQIGTEEMRVSKYITVIAIYPYEVSTSKSIKTFCIEGTGPSACTSLE